MPNDYEVNIIITEHPVTQSDTARNEAGDDSHQRASFRIGRDALNAKATVEAL